MGDLLRGEAFAGEYEPVTVALVPLARPGHGQGERRRPDRARRDDPRRRDRLGLRLVSDQPRHGGRNRLHDQSAPDHAGRGRGHAPGADQAILDDGPNPSGCQAGRLQGDDHDPCREGGNGSAPARVSRPRRARLDPVDIPAGPFGYTIGIPWFGDDPGAASVQPANGEKEPAENARLWLHSLQRAAVDRVPRVQPGQARPRFHCSRRLR